jgi:nucleotide-binding universal stress UspA family protein
MTAPRLITVGLDGSEGSRRALAWALRLAADTSATVEVVTAWTWDGMAFSPGMTAGPDAERSYVEQRQQTDIEKVTQGMTGPLPTISRTTAEGNPAKVLVEASRKADMLVLGSHGRSHVLTALLGSVSEACVRHGGTPVVIVPTHDRAAVSEDLVKA